MTAKHFFFSIAFALLLVVGGTSLMGQTKPRVVIMSDISADNAEPDDRQSFIRLLLYSNELDIAGIIGATSMYDREHTRGQAYVFNEVIDVYAQIRDNLLAHASGYPTAEYLKSIVFEGNRSVNGMEGVGDGLDTDGSDHIKNLLQDNSNSDPIWFLGWGGISTLAQAVYQLQQTMSVSEFEQVISKVRIYDIFGQDDCGETMANDFPGLFIIRSAEQFHSFTQRDNSPAPLSQEGDLSYVVPSWFQENIQSGHGVFGTAYPNRVYMFEGDTPSFLYLIDNGLSSPENPNFGGWGGRFSNTKDTDLHMYLDAKDQLMYQGTIYSTVFTPLWRWRKEYQLDFAARMDWTTTNDYSEVNHEPFAVVNAEEGSGIVYLEASPSSSVMLNASGSVDPDGDSLTYNWWYYKEAGTYEGDLKINGSADSLINIIVPENASAGDSLQIILSLSDNGTPHLTSYRRIVIVVNNQEQQVNILPLGNSLTQAYDGHNSFRRPLWQLNDAADYSVDFIGSLTTVYDNKPHPNTDFDTDHEGHWGWRADELVDSMDNWLLGYQADIVLLLIGSNDLGAGEATSEVLDDITSIITKLRADNDKTIIFLGNLPPTTLDDRADESVAFNALLPDFVEQISTGNSPVFLIDHHSTMTVNMLYDGIHPNEEGEEIMAENWFKAIESYFEGSLYDVPQAPTDLVLQKSDANTLGWNDNSWNETKFTIESSDDGIAFSPLAEVTSGITEYIDNSGTDSTFYRVKAQNRYGSSAPSNIVGEKPSSNGGIGFLSNQKITIRPNPAKQFVWILSSESNFKTVALYNLNGTLLKEYSTPERELLVSTSDLTPGLYLVKVLTQNNMETIRKLIIE